MTGGGAAVRVRPAVPADADAWCRMRTALWPEQPADHPPEIADYFAGRALGLDAVLVAADSGGRLLGFAELSLRPCAEGCVTSPVAYLEGWYVEPSARRGGVGGALVEAAAAWARDHGCRELASDAHPDNAGSLAAHRAVGFEDAGTVVCFRRAL